MEEEKGTVLKIEYQRDIDAAAARNSATNDDDDLSESDTQPFPIPPQQQPIIDKSEKKSIYLLINQQIFNPYFYKVKTWTTYFFFHNRIQHDRKSRKLIIIFQNFFP